MKSPSIFKYIGVWFVWSLTSAVFGFIVSFIIFVLGNFIIDYSCGMITNSLAIISIYTISALVFINLYKSFPDLKISKIMIYLWVLGFFAFAGLFNEVQNNIASCNYGENEEAMNAMVTFIGLVSYIVHNLYIRNYFLGKPQWEGKIN